MPPHRLIVAEKPSVARDIARVLGVTGRQEGFFEGEGIRVTWCVGHLVELADPSAYRAEWKAWSLDDLPIVVDRFQLVPREEGQDQWKVVSRLLRDRGLQRVVNACDAGREGELIFAHVYELAGCRAPVDRLWISSMTDAAIRTGFGGLQPGERFHALEQAARCRAEADWLVGLNATRAMTCRMRKPGDDVVLSLGRVQTPTLALIVTREDAIEGFQPQDFWEVRAMLEAPAGTWEGTWYRVPPEGPRETRILERSVAEATIDRVRQGGGGKVVRVERKEVRERPPLLYDLTTLQKEANRRFGWTAQQTLDLAQALYERRKVLTYPRTDARHLGTDLVPRLPEIIASLAFGPYEETARLLQGRWPVPLDDRVVDDAEVSDHHAIIPTGLDPRNQGLERDEKRLFDLVARRFLAVFLPDAVFAQVAVDALVGDDAGGELLQARGSVCREPGWQVVDPPRTPRKAVELPDLSVADPFVVREAGLHEGRTQPPKRHSEATLLGAMERAGEDVEEETLKRALKKKGLGTPATRAAIIETLLRRRYVVRRETHLVPTPQGRALLAALPVEALRSARMTGEWEARLAEMAEGREDRGRFMADIRHFTAEVVSAIRGGEVEERLQRELAPDVAAMGELLGRCPRCGGEVRGVRGGWRCVGCVVFVPSQVARREVSRRMARQILAEGVSAPVKGFRSRAGKEFTASLALGEDGRVAFRFPDPISLGACPACGKPVRHRGKVYRCDTGRDCPFVVFGETAGVEVTEEAVTGLLAAGHTGPLEGLKDRDGRVFRGRLAWVGRRVVVERLPPDGAAFGRRVDCPRCVARNDPDPGFLKAGREAWGCSRWSDGCRFRIPFEVRGVRLPEDQALRLLQRGATEALAHLGGARLVLRPEAEPPFEVRPTQGIA